MTLLKYKVHLYFIYIIIRLGENTSFGGNDENVFSYFKTR